METSGIQWFLRKRQELMQKYWKGEVEGLSEELKDKWQALVSFPFPPAGAPSSLVLEDSSCTFPPDRFYHSPSRQASAGSLPLLHGKAALALGFSPGVPQIIP